MEAAFECAQVPAISDPNNSPCLGSHLQGLAATVPQSIRPARFPAPLVPTSGVVDHRLGCDIRLLADRCGSGVRRACSGESAGPGRLLSGQRLSGVRHQVHTCSRRPGIVQDEAKRPGAPWIIAAKTREHERCGRTIFPANQGFRCRPIWRSSIPWILSFFQ